MKLLIVGLILIKLSFAYGQFTSSYDTLTYNDRMHGDLDSIDIASADYPSTFAGGIAMTSPHGVSTQSLFNKYTSSSFEPALNPTKMKFSALPHLGFSYSFGGQGSQFIRANYLHAFSDSINLNIDYQRNSGIGSVRNSNFSLNKVNLQFNRLGKFYSLNIQGTYFKSTTQHSGGVLTDSLIEDFGLEFSPVNKENALATNKSGRVQITNYFDFNSTVENAFGILINNEYTIKNKVYSEFDTLFGLYNAIYIDSFSTRDQYNLAEISNGAGLFLKRKSFYVDGMVNHSYWDFQNLGEHLDTNELFFSSFLSLDWKGVSIENKLKLNIIGRYNEFRGNTKVFFQRGKIDLAGQFLFEKKAPIVLQRSYFGNTNKYNLAENDLQEWTKIGINFRYALNNKLKISTFGNLYSIPSVYLYNGSDWRLENIKSNFGRLGIRSDIELGSFHIQPQFVYSFDDNNFLPQFQAYSRLYFQGFLFKGKKLEVAIGVDVSYLSRFDVNAYVPNMDAFDFNSTNQSFSEMSNLHAFLNLGISEFRFFFRYENIGYFWSDKKSVVLANYPIAGSRLRIGLTWDFFN